MVEKNLERLVVTHEGVIIHGRNGKYFKENVITAKPIGHPVIVGNEDFPHDERPSMVWLKSEAPEEANAYVYGRECLGYIPVQFYKVE